MQVEMVDGLTAIVAGIHYDTVATIELLSTRQLRGRSHQMSQNRGVRFGRVGHGGHMLFGNDEEVPGRLRMDVGKRKCMLVFEKTLRRNRAGNDPAEETIGSHGLILALPPCADIVLPPCANTTSRLARIRPPALREYGLYGASAVTLAGHLR